MREELRSRAISLFFGGNAEATASVPAVGFGAVTSEGGGEKVGSGIESTGRTVGAEVAGGAAGVEGAEVSFSALTRL